MKRRTVVILVAAFATHPHLDRLAGQQAEIDEILRLALHAERKMKDAGIILDRLQQKLDAKQSRS